MSVPVAIEPPPHMSGHHRHTYEAILRLPTAHALDWHDVRSFLDSVAVVTEGDHGSLHASRNGRTVRLHAPKHKDTPAETIQDIRHFLQASGTPATTGSTAVGTDLLVVIDHREAKVYRTEVHGSVPLILVPYDPQGHGQNLHSANEWTDGKRPPDRTSDYEAVAKVLTGASRIVLFGSGTGRSSAMDQLMAELTAHHAEIAAKVLGTIVVDLHHSTEQQLLAEARAVFARQDVVQQPATAVATGNSETSRG